MAVRQHPGEIQHWQTDLLKSVRVPSLSNESLTQLLISRSTTIHLAVFQEPYLSFILEGKKTVESRFSLKKTAPYGSVEKGDVILMKRVSGPIVAACLVEYVWDYLLDPQKAEEVIRTFENALCASDSSFWESRKQAKFATLIKVQNVTTLEPVSCDKKDRRGWVILQRKPTLPFDLELE